MIGDDDDDAMMMMIRTYCARTLLDYGAVRPTKIQYTAVPYREAT